MRYSVAAAPRRDTRMPSRRIVLHLRSTGALLGAERVILQLAARSEAHGYTPVVAGVQDRRDPSPELCRLAREMGIESYVFPCRAGFDRSLAALIRQTVRERGVSLMHCHGYKDDIHALAARAGVVKVATNHLWKGTSWRSRLYVHADALALRRFDHVVAVSRPILDDMRRRGLKASKTSLIPNGIDSAPFATPLSDDRRRALRPELGLEPSDVVAVSVSSLTPEKGHRYVLEGLPRAAQTFPALRWLVVGDGPLREAIHEQAVALGISERVRLVGWRRDVPDLLRASDLFLLPSLVEGLPMALLEAMAAGLPAVASAVGDVATVIDDGRNGTLCAPGDVAALGTGISRYAGDAGLRNEHGARARATVEERFSSRAMAAAYCALYDELLSRRGGA